MAMRITIFCSAALSTGCSTLRDAFSACPSAAVAHSPAAVLTPLPVCTLVLICGGWFVAAVASGIHWRLGRSRVGVAESMAAVPLLDGRCCAAYRALLLPLPGRMVASLWFCGGLLLQWIASAPGVCALPGRHLFTSIAACRIVTSISRPIAMPIAIAAIAAIASAIAITDQRHHCYQYQPHTASRVPTTAATTCLECPLLASTIAHSHNNAMLLPQCLRIVTATVTRRCPRQPGVAYQVEWPTQRLPRTHAHLVATTVGGGG